MWWAQSQCHSRIVNTCIEVDMLCPKDQDTALTCHHKSEKQKWYKQKTDPGILQEQQKHDVTKIRTHTSCHHMTNAESRCNRNMKTDIKEAGPTPTKLQYSKTLTDESSRNCAMGESRVDMMSSRHRHSIHACSLLYSSFSTSVTSAAASYWPVHADDQFLSAILLLDIKITKVKVANSDKHSTQCWVKTGDFCKTNCFHTVLTTKWQPKWLSENIFTHRKKYLKITESQNKRWDKYSDHTSVVAFYE